MKHVLKKRNKTLVYNIRIFSVAQLGSVELGGRSPLSFFKNLKKSALILWKKCPDCVHLWMKFLNLNAF